MNGTFAISRGRTRLCFRHFLPSLMRLLGLFLILSVAVFNTAAFAQDVDAARSTLSDAEAQMARAERLLEGNRAQASTLETMRSDLAKLRDAAATVVDHGSVAARTIQAQIDSLGSPPLEGETEAEDIAARRAELAEELGHANEPVRDAQEVLRRSEILIGEIDRRIRRLAAEKLSVRYPTPLMPTRWATAFQELNAYFARVNQEIAVELERPEKTKQLLNDLPTMVFLFVIALLTLFVLQPILPRLADRAAAKDANRLKSWFFIVLANSGRLILPAIAAVVLIAIVNTAEIKPFSIRSTLEALPAFAAILVFAHWLGHTIFVPANASIRLLPLDDRQAYLGLRMCQGLGLMFAANGLLQMFERDHSFSDASVAVLSTPIILVIAALLWALSRLLQSRHETAGHPSEGEMNAGFLKIVSTLMWLSAIAATLLALTGYINLAWQASAPTIMTLALLGLALFFYKTVMIVLNSLLGRSHTDGEEALSLLPVGVVFVIVLGLLPLLALTWGARSTDIAEAWRLLNNGVEIGEVRLSLNVVITLVLVFSVGVVLTQWLQRILRINVLSRTRLDMGARTAIVTGVGYVGLILTGLVAVSAAGLNLSSLAVVFGALGVGIGFGLQNIVSNFVSGIILLIERPIKEGDWIEVSGYSGVVKKIAVRSTRIQTFDHHDVIIPNSDLMSGTVKNMTLSNMTGRIIIPVGVAYGSDLEKTRDILLTVASENGMLARNPEPQVLFMGLGDSSLNFELRCFLKNINNIMVAHSDLLFEIYKQLEAADIEIPFPQRDIHLRDIDKLVDAIAGTRQKPATNRKGTPKPV